MRRRLVDDVLPTRPGLKLRGARLRVHDDLGHLAGADQHPAGGGDRQAVPGGLHGDRQVVGGGERDRGAHVAGVGRGDDHRRRCW